MTGLKNVNSSYKHFERKLTKRRIKFKIASAKPKKRKKMNILQPLLLDRSCLVKKMQKLSPLIDKLEWINTNDRAFQAYWSYYATGCKKRQQDIRQRIEQNADFVQNIKNKKAASFLKILTQDTAPIDAHNEPINTIYEELLECFRKPPEKKRRKREKPSEIFWQREADNALIRLTKTRNPYDIAQIIGELKKIEQLQSVNQASPYPARFKTPRVKYVTKPTRTSSLEKDIGIDVDKTTAKSRKKSTEIITEEATDLANTKLRKDRNKNIRLQRANLNASKQFYVDEKYPKKEIAKFQDIPLQETPETISTEVKKKLKQKIKPNKEIISTGLKKERQQRKKREEKTKTKTKGMPIKKEVPHSESLKEQEYLQLKKAKNKEITPIKSSSKIDLPDELIKKHHILKDRKSSVSSRKSSTRNSSIRKDSSGEFKSWYEEFAKHKAQYTKSRLRSLIKPKRKSSLISQQDSVESTTTKSKQPKKKKENNQKIDMTAKIQQFQRDNPFLAKYFKKFGHNIPQIIDDIGPHQDSNVDEEASLDDMNLHHWKHFPTATFIPKLVGKYKGPPSPPFESQSSINTAKEVYMPKIKRRSLEIGEARIVDIPEIPEENIRKKSKAKSKNKFEPKKKHRVKRIAPNASIQSTDRTTPLSSEGTVRDMSKWDKIFKHLDKSNRSNETVHKPQELHDFQVEKPPIGFKLTDKEVAYNNPYERDSFLSRISNAFELAKNQIGSKTNLTMTSLKSQVALHAVFTRKSNISRLLESSDRSSLFRFRSTTHRIPEPPPIIIADVVAEFLKSRSIEAIFKDICPNLFKPPEEDDKLKEPIPTKPKIDLTKCKKHPSKLQLKPKACLNCGICKQLISRSSTGMHPYMIRMQCQHKKHELRSYYKQMMLRNCQLAKDLQAQRHPKDHFCHMMS
ncbi:uncharacterized protein LOC117783871 [Drosophila innubila]|uniref:uncharacterized protein LOC117783871 n=1 Tax=Drosophila innubila TaxID=198719 RepID=UPI00148BBEE6|nr:uncharacterized protein LOC117783871 [Drosophila innubila]